MKRFVLSTTVQIHTFDVARELQRRRLLATLYSGYPAARLRALGIEGPEVRSFSLPGMAAAGIYKYVRSEALRLRGEPWPKAAYDALVARAVSECDVFLATSSTATKSGPQAQKKGALWVCDRPCSHILDQNETLRDEYERYGKRWPGISTRIVERELQEYDASDAILVPSGFAERTFLARGLPAEKLWRIPYGVDISRFKPGPPPDPERFDVLFAGQLIIRKGLKYLLEAFKAVEHPRKRLTLAGSRHEHTDSLLAGLGDDVQVLGKVPQPQLAELMSRSHVMVLPSIEEGLALVQAQALACGCPVIATPNTGGEDLFEDGEEGFIVPIRSSEAIAQRLQQLADDPELRQKMSTSALAKAQAIGGWGRYVDELVTHCEAPRS